MIRSFVIRRTTISLSKWSELFCCCWSISAAIVHKYPWLLCFFNFKNKWVIWYRNEPKLCTLDEAALTSTIIFFSLYKFGISGCSLHRHLSVMRIFWTHFNLLLSWMVLAQSISSTIMCKGFKCICKVFYRLHDATCNKHITWKMTSTKTNSEIKSYLFCFSRKENWLISSNIGTNTQL